MILFGKGSERGEISEVPANDFLLHHLVNIQLYAILFCQYLDAINLLLKRFLIHRDGYQPMDYGDICCFLLTRVAKRRFIYVSISASWLPEDAKLMTILLEANSIKSSIWWSSHRVVNEFPLQIVSILQSYLQEHKFQVHFGEAKSICTI